jgi:hypothetical protein
MIQIDSLISDLERAKNRKPVKWRLIQMCLTGDIRNALYGDVRGAVRVLWGFDIWIEDVPFMKTIVFANIVVWILMALA